MWTLDNHNNDIFGVYHRKTFDFHQEIIIPAFPKVTLTAHAHPTTGSMPFEAVYELAPIKAEDNVISAKILEASVAKCGKQKSVEITNRGTVLAAFNGLINIDSGNEVHLDIKSIPINNVSETGRIPISFPSNETGGTV